MTQAETARDDARPMATRMDGTALAKKIRGRLRDEIGSGDLAAHRPPCLAVVLVGDDPASHVYVRNKHRACEEVGIESRRLERPANLRAEELRALIGELNADDGVDGVLVQLPVPDPIDPAQVREWIDPHKDVDGVHPANVGLLASGTPRFVSCTPAGCLQLLREYDIQTRGQRAVVIGRSLIVGRPMANLLSMPGVDATVTICHSRTVDLAEETRRADILIAAAGVPQVVRAEHVKPGAAVVDVGIHRVPDATRKSGARLVGDVEPEVAKVAGFLSPVPGGVGPMTIAMLLSNTVDAYRSRFAS